MLIDIAVRDKSYVSCGSNQEASYIESCLRFAGILQTAKCAFSRMLVVELQKISLEKGNCTPKVRSILKQSPASSSGLILLLSKFERNFKIQTIRMRSSQFTDDA